MARRSSTVLGFLRLVLSFISTVFIFAVAATYAQSPSPGAGGSQRTPATNGTAKPSFLVAHSIPISGKPAALAAADLNNDGQVDLVVANAESGTVDVFLGIGRGKFGPARRYSVGPSPSAILVADFNGDGIPD